MRKLLTGLWILAFCAMTTLLIAAPGSAQPLPPDLQPFPGFDLRIGTNFSTGGTELRFSTRSWNRGIGPLELVAGDVTSSGQDVYQRVYNSDGTYTDYFAGSFVYHPAHNHFHFNNYALYSLQPISAPGGSPKSGSKTTFCIMDTTKVDTTLPGAPPTAVYSTCGTTIQGMSIGWGDTYGYQLEGQSIDITGNPSGDYCLSIRIDPQSRLIETDETNNVASSLLRLDMEHSTVTVLDNTGCAGDVVVDSLTPASAHTGTSTPVTITGSGFAPGMTVSFVNGSGPTPTVSKVVVSPDGTTIQAIVTVKRSKSAKDPVWDLRVGSGILFNAFTVLP